MLELILQIKENHLLIQINKQNHKSVKLFKIKEFKEEKEEKLIYKKNN